MAAGPIPNIGEDLIDPAQPTKIRQRWWDWLRNGSVGGASPAGSLILRMRIINQLGGSFSIASTDFAFYVTINSLLPITGLLPPATGSGRVLAFKRITTGGAPATIAFTITPNGTDNLDDMGAGVSVILHNRQGLIIQDAAAGIWYTLARDFLLAG